MLVHYLKAPHRDPSVVYPQIDEEVFRAVIRSCEKVEQGFMVDFRRVFVEHDDQLQVRQNGMDISRRPRKCQMF